MGDHYRPSYYNHPPPGFNPMPPLPYGPPPDMPPPPSYYQFGANSYNRQGGYGPQGPYGNNAFNFNANAQLPRFPEERRAQYARQEEARYNDRRAFGPPRNDGGDRRHGEYNRRGDGALRSRRGRPMPRVATADRPLLVYERSGTPDQLAGMATNGEARFLDVDELSDSSEEPMEESDASHPLGEDTQDTDENFVVTKTVQVLSTEVKPAAPKWTSAEVYTELPPVDDSARKKKNIVKMIRKARVTGQPQASGANQVAANDNFISFDFEDDDVQEDEEALIGQGVPGAPTGPKAFDQGGLSTPLQPQPPVSFSGQMVSGTIDMPKPSPIDVNLEITESVTAVLEGDRKRKRSEDDTDIAEVPQPKYAKGLKLFGFGAVLEEWNGVESGRALPWLDGQNYKLTENAGFR